jgi:hypothetical protein
MDGKKFNWQAGYPDALGTVYAELHTIIPKREVITEGLYICSIPHHPETLIAVRMILQLTHINLCYVLIFNIDSSWSVLYIKVGLLA